jgi:hypothetical protein
MSKNKQKHEITKDDAKKLNKQLAKLRQKEQEIKDREKRKADNKIKKEIEKIIDEEIIIFAGDLSSSSWVEYTDDNVLVKKTDRGKKGINERIVYKGLFNPIQKLNIDGNKFYEIDLHERIIGNVRDILNFMRLHGGVISNNDLSDCVNAVISSMELPIKYGHSTYGVYNDNNKLSLCLDPYCITDEQKRIKLQIRWALNEPLSKESIEGYVKTLKFWNPYEVLLAFSYGIMSPFAYVLKEKNILIPYPFHSSPENSLGKSLVAKIFSQNLYGVISESMASVYSDFRIADTLDSFCGPKCIDEAQKYNWNSKLGEKIKQSAENPLQDKRGASDKSTQIYYSRLIGIFTGNGFPITGNPDLVRIFRVEFDMNKKPERINPKKSKTLLKLVRQLRPIGFRFVENELNDLKYDLNELINRAEKYGDDIVGHYGKFSDARRPTAWGFIYEGLKAWERVCKKYEVDWTAPAIKKFTNDVVKIIEGFTFESKEIPVEDFLDWFENYKDKDGEKLLGKTWLDNHNLEVKGKNYYGYVITSPVLKAYNRTTKHSEIKNMGDLARSISALSGLPLNEIYEGKVFKFGDKTKRGVFLENKIFSHEITCNFVTRRSTTGENESYNQSDLKEKECNHEQQEKKDKGYKVTPQSDVKSIHYKNKSQQEKIEKLKGYFKKCASKGYETLSYTLLCDQFDPGFIENCKKRKIIIPHPKGGYIFNENK